MRSRSLGSVPAELDASRFGLHVETFNSHGAAGLGYDFPTDPGQLINHVLAGDPVSAGRPCIAAVDSAAECGPRTAQVTPGTGKGRPA